VYRAIKSIDSSARFPSRPTGPADLSATQIERARKPIVPGSPRCACSRFAIAICSLPVMEITGGTRAAPISILDIRRLRTAAAYRERVPRETLRFGDGRLDFIYRRAF